MEQQGIITLQAKDIQGRILTLRNKQVMLDTDLADLYQVNTKVLNQAVKRNIARFPERFRFQLNTVEKNELVTNCDRFEKLKHSTNNPFVFTEQGVAMLSAVLRSEIAIQVSIQIMEAFVHMWGLLNENALLYQRLSKVEQNQQIAEEKINTLLDAMQAGSLTSKQGIFYDGQIFDAYVFVNKLIKSAKQDIILIDNYIDESVLALFSIRQKPVKVTLFTGKITKKLELDIEKHNQQYPNVDLKELKKSHDRFLIIDHTTVYHIGASLKDLGKKWFAFSHLEIDVAMLLQQVDA